MEILKQLNLNGNPQVVPNGSLVFAKNIKLSDDGTYITNDDGFDVAFVGQEPSNSVLKVSNINGEFVSSISVEGIEYSINSIVGYINCPNEIVLLAYKEYTDSGNLVKLSEIYRAVEIKNSDKLALYKVPTVWEYNGGKIIGTYTYNVYNHLIIAIAESDADFDKQLMTIDLNESTAIDLIDKYSCAPSIPICNLSFLQKVKGTPIPNGLYYFFIRYEISDKVYTNWFPIGAPQYALSLDYKTIINHWYKGQSNNLKKTETYALINTNRDSYYNFSFSISFDTTYDYKGYQIGYILQKEDTSVARIWKNFAFKNSVLYDSFTFNGGFIEEGDIDSFIKNVINLYDIKAITKYDNKLYIANFKETDYNISPQTAEGQRTIQDLVDAIQTYQVKRKVDIKNNTESNTIMDTWTYTIGDTSVSIQVVQGTQSISMEDFTALVNLIADKMDYYYSYEIGGRFDGKKVTNRSEWYELILSEDGIIVNPNTETEDNIEYYTGREGSGTFVWKRHSTGGDSPDSSYEIAYGTVGNIKIKKTTGVVNYTSYNQDNVIRTLMPNEVYAFYIHFIRKDGSYTNGYPLSNKNNIQTYYTKLSDLGDTFLETEGLLYFKSNPQTRDKYYFEVCKDTSGVDNGLFIPFITEDGRRLFKTGSGVIYKQEEINNNVVQVLDGLARIGVRFTNITIPAGFVAYFFSYEKVEPLVSHQSVIIDKIQDHAINLAKAGDVEYFNSSFGGSLFIPHHKVSKTTGALSKVDDSVKYAYINSSSPVLSNAKTTFIGTEVSRFGTHGGILFSMISNQTVDGNYDVHDVFYTPVANETLATDYIVGSVINFNRSVYSSDNKELIPFGPVGNTSVYGEFTESGDTTINYNMNYPSFIIEDKMLIYSQPIHIDEELNVHNISGNTISDLIDINDYASIRSVFKFSNVNLLGLSFKKEPEEAAGVINNNQITLNTIVRPLNVSDLFKLESCYIPKNNKPYTNYNRYLTTPARFTNVIRVSYPIRNESNVNSWRLLDPSMYHVVDSSSGDIVNIFGSGSIFYVHTKNNLLVTQGNAKLEADSSSIHIKDNHIFDIAPKELFSSDLGYGGIKYRECQLFSQHGYIWYDSDRYKLLRFDNGNLVDVTSGIDELIKKYKFEKCYINVDNETNRLLFAFREGINDVGLTLGYDTLGNKWLSLYDYTFDKSIHTANYCLFGLGTNPVIYKHTKDAEHCDYKILKYFNVDFPKYESDTYVKYCCFDIIFNLEYINPKVLESISWIHEIITRNTLDESHSAELKIVNRTIDNKINDLTGMYINIYTDSVDSGLLDIKPTKLNDVANIDNPDSYKYPYYNKGVWNYSYFRNNVTTKVTNTELVALAQAYGVNVNILKDVYKITDKNGNQIYVDGNPLYNSSDLRSLIYGKYIVVRFIYKANNKFKFDNLVFNVNRY